MILIKRIFVIFLLTSLCFACTQRPARIIRNGDNFYGKNSSHNQEKYRGFKYRSLKDGNIKVESGDTLYGIAKEYSVPLGDLIEENKLTPPYNLFAGQYLSIPSPTYHEVKAGETLLGIANTYSMNMNNIVNLNNLEPPYLLKTGQRIRISNNSIKKVEKSVAPVESRDLEPPKKSYVPTIVQKTLDKFNHFSWPLNGKVISKFGPKTGGLYNDGINISAASGTLVKASEDGEVAYVGNELKGYGNLIIVKHSGGWITAYAHLSQTLVQKGQRVNKLDVIAKSGETGNVSSPQLYFGLRKGRDAVNPMNYLKE